MNTFNKKAARAAALEEAGLWRRAARCWLEVMDSNTDEAEREKIAKRRAKCMSMAGSGSLSFIGE